VPGQIFSWCNATARPPLRLPLRNTAGYAVGDEVVVGTEAADEAAAGDGRIRTRRPLGDRSGMTTTSG